MTIPPPIKRAHEMLQHLKPSNFVHHHKGEPDYYVSFAFFATDLTHDNMLEVFNVAHTLDLHAGLNAILRNNKRILIVEVYQ